MADDDSTSTAADPASSSSSSSSASSGTEHHHPALEAAVDRIETAVNQLVPGSHAEAQDRTERRLDRGSSMAEQVRAELAKAKEEDAAAAAAAASTEEARGKERRTEERLARLEERPPAPPRLRRTRLLGWGDGRG
jgi:hypothetical protein